jgi:hypothetical protein
VLKIIMKAAPERVFMIDWSRKVLRFWTSGAISEPEVAEERTQLIWRGGMEGAEVVELEVMRVVRFIVALLAVVLAVLVVLVAWLAWTRISNVTEWVKEPLVPVIWIVNVPGEAVEFALMVKGEEAVPPEKGVMGEEKERAMPAGALPTQEVDKPTAESKPLLE